MRTQDDRDRVGHATGGRAILIWYAGSGCTQPAGRYCTRYQVRTSTTRKNLLQGLACQKQHSLEPSASTTQVVQPVRREFLNAAAQPMDELVERLQAENEALRNELVGERKDSATLKAELAASKSEMSVAPAAGSVGRELTVVNPHDLEAAVVGGGQDVAQLPPVVPGPAVGAEAQVSAVPGDSMHGARVDKPDILISIIKTRLTLDFLLWDRTSGYYGGTE